MDKWRTKVERGQWTQIPKEFTGDCMLFRQEATRIRDDYGGQFWALADALSGLHNSEVGEINHDRKWIGRETLLTKIDAVVNFVKAS